MGTHGYSQDCPKCNGKESLMVSEETRSINISAECLECGLTYYTQEGRLSLEEVNELRNDREMNSLKELRKWG